MRFARFDKHENRQLAWKLRHERGWTLRQIARRLGVKPPAVSRLLARATGRGGAANFSRQRVVRPVSLSEEADT